MPAHHGGVVFCGFGTVIAPFLMILRLFVLVARHFGIVLPLIGLVLRKLLRGSLSLGPVQRSPFLLRRGCRRRRRGSLLGVGHEPCHQGTRDGER